MIFQHTLGDVLSGRKTATTRIWKENYFSIRDKENNLNDMCYDQLLYVGSRKTQRKIYYPNQQHAVQPGRGKKGIARLEITGLFKVMIHNVIDDPDFIYREGFDSKAEFLQVWRAMHGTAQMGLHIKFKLLKD